MNSTNGTFVNGEKLLPSVKKSLRDADEVAFGPGAKLIFFTAPGFCELLKELDQDASQERGPNSGARPAGLAG
jgi:pSer/pThr/pTyr-binding forkhead associated (FHA) protein